MKVLFFAIGFVLASAVLSHSEEFIDLDVVQTYAGSISMDAKATVNSEFIDDTGDGENTGDHTVDYQTLANLDKGTPPASWAKVHELFGRYDMNGSEASLKFANMNFTSDCKIEVNSPDTCKAESDGAASFSRDFRSKPHAYQFSYLQGEFHAEHTYVGGHNEGSVICVFTYKCGPNDMWVWWEPTNSRWVMFGSVVGTDGVADFVYDYVYSETIDKTYSFNSKIDQTDLIPVALDINISNEVEATASSGTGTIEKRSRTKSKPYVGFQIYATDTEE